MKQTLFYHCFSMVCILFCFVSCDQSNVPSGPYLEAPFSAKQGYWFEPSENYSNQLVPLAKDVTKTYDQPSIDRKDIKENMTFDISSFGNLCFIVYPNPYEHMVFSTDDEEEYEEANERWQKFIKTFQYDCEKYDTDITQEYIYAGIQDGASLTANKVLFGIQPGGNLMSHFRVALSDEQLIAAVYPDFKVRKDYRGNSNAVPAEECFAAGAMLSRSPYWLYPIDLPAEAVEEVTFTFTLPIETEYLEKIVYDRDYPEEWYEQGLLERNDNRVLKGYVTVQFEK